MPEPPDIPRQAIRRPMTVDTPPHWRASETAGRIYAITIYAALPAVLAGLAFFGLPGLMTLVVAVGSTLVFDWLFARLARRPTLARYGGRIHTLLMGLLLGMSLPVTTTWPVVVLAAVVVVVLGKGLLGGIGHYLWHPVLLGRFVIQVFFYDQISPDRLPLLDRHHLYLGSFKDAAFVPVYSSWVQLLAPGQAQAVQLADPLLAIRDLVTGRADWVRQAIEQANAGGAAGSPSGAALHRLLWAHMPDLRDFLLGSVPGPIGATCAIALLAGGLLLIYHGYVRWQMVVAFFAAAAVTAAVAPLRIGPLSDGVPAWQWLPGLRFYNSMPVGPIYVLYQLLAGSLLLGVFFFAADMVARPITLSGQVLFGIGCGVLTILIRLYLFLPDSPHLFAAGAVFLAILLMNTLVPLIDRITQPRAFGH
jgi:electron transport complex protein RnfD